MRKECVITSYSSVKSCDFLSRETRSYVLLIKGFTSTCLSFFVYYPAWQAPVVFQSVLVSFFFFIERGEHTKGTEKERCARVLKVSSLPLHATQARPR